MANTIALAQKFIPMLDEVYQAACLTAVLDGAEELVQQGANANELIVPMLQLQGLGDYDRNTGYAAGDVTLTNETVKCNFDRGRMFSVDNMDNEETAGVAFGHLAGEFIRTKVAPELDAFRFASYCSKEGVTPVEETLDDGAKVIAALRKAVIAMDEAEVPAEERYLFITPTLYGMVEDMETTSSRQVLGRFAGVMQVPHTRFYTAIQQKTGKMPLVLHGGTGIPADMIKKAISLGVSKINVNTECQLAFADATRKYIEAGKDQQGKGFDPRKLLAPGFEAIKATVKEKMELFGSVNKA